MADNSQTDDGTQSEAPEAILARVFDRAANSIGTPLLNNSDALRKIDYLVRNNRNKSGPRVLLACSLAKLHNTSLDIRKPYTEIGTPDSYSGRARYDEGYIDQFVRNHKLPCNPTTAWLTPAWRNIEATLTRDVNLVGTPREVYRYVVDLLNDVHEGTISAEDLLSETIRGLLIVRNEQQLRMESMLAALQPTGDDIYLSAEGIVTLIQQHMALPRTSRLPVLIVAASYEAASATLGEQALPLNSHNAADRQTGALGDVEIVLLGDSNVLTAYEMKDKHVQRGDIDIARRKVATFFRDSHRRIDNYIFITTEAIDLEVQEYAKSLYETTGGIEFVVLDCIGFLRHFLHMFHRLRMPFLKAYQTLLVEDNAVNQELKEAFLSMRLAAESHIAETFAPSGK